MNDIPDDVMRLVKLGYELKKSNTEQNERFNKWRVVARKWRNLVGEARFDIPPCLHKYINWSMPKEWEILNLHCIHTYNFIINIPGFKSISVNYKVKGLIKASSCDWLFNNFNILESKKSSNNYEDLPLFLAMAQKVKRNKVEIKEIEGGLADNAKLIKMKIENCYVLTEQDFLNNPGDDEIWNNPIYA